MREALSSGSAVKPTVREGRSPRGSTHRHNIQVASDNRHDIDNKRGLRDVSQPYEGLVRQTGGTQRGQSSGCTFSHWRQESP